MFARSTLKRNSASTFVLSFALLLVCLCATGCAGSQPTPTDTPAPATEPTTAEASAEDGAILLVTGEFPPFTSENLDGGGISTEIIRAAFAEMERPVRIEFYPWERSEAMVQSGEAWGAFPYVPTSERQERYLVSNPISYARTMLFYHDDALEGVQYNALADLQPYRIGVSLGYWYIPMFEEAALTLDEGSDDLANLRKLQAGRIDVFPIHEYIGGWLIQNNFAENADSFRTLETPLDISSDAVIASRSYSDSEVILSEFNTALQTIIDSGVYDAIFESYGLTPFTADDMPA
jgi:polar amino acid transport system substrate-binding protein